MIHTDRKNLDYYTLYFIFKGTVDNRKSQKAEANI